MTVALFLLVLAAVLFLIGAFVPYYRTGPGVAGPFYTRINLISLGLFFYVAAQLVGHLASR
jgi:hypothetical protein